MGGNVFIDLFKAKNEEKHPKDFFYYCLDQKPFCPFLENQTNNLETLILNYLFWRLFFSLLYMV